MKTNKIKLLIVENNHDEVVLINELLRAAFGQAVEVIDQAESYKIAIDLLKQKNYDVCLCDYRRDGLNGIEFLREVRGKKNIAPVVFLADQIDQEVAVGAIKAGAADYLNKANLTHEMLGKSVLHAIQLFREEEGRRLTQNKLEKKKSSKGIDPQFFRRGNICFGFPWTHHLY